MQPFNDFGGERSPSGWAALSQKEMKIIKHAMASEFNKNINYSGDSQGENGSNNSKFYINEQEPDFPGNIHLKQQEKADR